MKCPKCKKITLKKKNHNSPYFCENCQGMWVVDYGSISSLDLDEEDNAVCSEQNNDHKTGLCPAGHGIMSRAKIDIDKPFYLEKCTACGGVWFDKGEWEQIVDNQLNDNLDLVWSNTWQKAQRQAKNHQSFLDMNRDILGDELFSKIVDLSTQLKSHPERSRAVAFLQQELEGESCP